VLDLFNRKNVETTTSIDVFDIESKYSIHHLCFTLYSTNQNLPHVYLFH